MDAHPDQVRDRPRDGRHHVDQRALQSLSAGRASCAGSGHEPCRWTARRNFHSTSEFLMGKYFIAWLLGVPGIVLVLLYLFFH
jgi:hypothetical protein